MRRNKALLVLEDGRVFTGTPFGAVGQTLGEAVFSTGMSGYQETLTDPSYHRQIVVATAPQIGNTGWNHEDAESRGDKIWVAGYAVRDPSPRASNWRATGTLEDELVRQGIVGIAGIDTRAVVRHLRSRGSMKAGVFSGAALAEPAELVERVRGQPSMLGADLAGEVSTAGHLHRGTRRAATIYGRRPGPRHQDQHTAQLRQARRPQPRAAVGGDLRARSPNSSPTGCSCPTGPATRRPPTTSSRHPRGAGRRNPAVRHLLRQSDPRPRTGPVDLQDGVRASRHQRPGHRPRHRPGRGDGAEPRFRARRRGGARPSTRHSARRGQSHLRQRWCRRGRQTRRRPGVFGAIPPGGGGRPARCGVSVRPVRRPDGGGGR